MDVDFKLWNGLAPRLLSFVRKRVVDRAMAQDVVQDVFLQFHQRGFQIKDPAKLNGWIFRVAQNRIVDIYRDQRRSETVIQDNDAVEENGYNHCVSNCLKEELKSLPEKYRTAFELSEIKNIPQTQMALEMGISYSGLKSRVQRARELLKMRMKEKYLIEYDHYGNILVCENRPGVSCSQKS